MVRVLIRARGHDNKNHTKRRNAVQIDLPMWQPRYHWVWRAEGVCKLPVVGAQWEGVKGVEGL